ncbi:MAG: hypothetical protein IPJ71_02055 [Bdellovibrionales bacterium]|nr:hypothetical protein [Bdellovibrionales bacterium]
MSSKSYEVVFNISAVKELQALPQEIQRKIIDTIQLLSLNPYIELLQTKRMKGADSLYRFRVQDHRVSYLIEIQIIRVTII